MRFIHLSDLHLGKRVNGFSMLEDQEFILKEILMAVDQKQPQAVIIAGDIYDKPVPPAEAVQMFDAFLSELSGRGIAVLMISGNHDSAQRIAFGARLMTKSRVYTAPVYNGEIAPVVLGEGEDTVRFYLLPFIKPAQVRQRFPKEEITTYTDAVRTAIRHMPIDADACNVLVTHQFVTGALRSESEEISVGGADNVDASVFDGFAYVALGHIHGPQKIGKETIRYCGTPLKYSFSEKDHIKSVTVVDLVAQKEVKIHTMPLVPLHDMREIRGTYDELMNRSAYEHTATEDYLRVILTDEEDVPDAAARLRVVYKNLMRVEYDNARTRSTQRPDTPADLEKKDELSLLAGFYEIQNGQPLSPEQLSYAKQLFEELKEEAL